MDGAGIGFIALFCLPLKQFSVIQAENPQRSARKAVNCAGKPGKGLGFAMHIQALPENKRRKIIWESCTLAFYPRIWGFIPTYTSYYLMTTVKRLSLFQFYTCYMAEGAMRRIGYGIPVLNVMRKKTKLL